MRRAISCLRRGGGLMVLGAQSVPEPRPRRHGRRRRTAGRTVPPASMRPRHHPRTAVPFNALPDRSRGSSIPSRGSVCLDDKTRKRWDILPALAGRLRSGTGRPRPGATVLATTGAAGAARPLIAVQRYGEGRSMVFTGEASWRWRESCCPRPTGRPADILASVGQVAGTWRDRPGGRLPGGCRRAQAKAW